MGYKCYNSNPDLHRTDDCTVRAIAKATSQDWESVYIALALYGLIRHDMPHKNTVWSAYLRDQGWKRKAIPDTCPDCYTVRDFSSDHPRGRFVLCLSSHVVPMIDGEWIDSWDSGGELVFYYWSKSVSRETKKNN